MKKRKADPTFDAIKNQKSQLLQKIAESKLLLYELNANPEGLQFNLRKWIENLDNAKELSKKLSKFSDDLRDLLVIHQGFLYDDAVRRRNFTFLSLLIQLYNSVKELSEHLAVPEYIWMQRYFLRVYPDRFILQPVISEMLTIVDDVIGELEEWQQ